MSPSRGRYVSGGREGDYPRQSLRSARDLWKGVARWNQSTSRRAMDEEMLQTWKCGCGVNGLEEKKNGKADWNLLYV